MQRLMLIAALAAPAAGWSADPAAIHYGRRLVAETYACIGPEVGQVVTPHGELVTQVSAAGQLSRRRVIAELLAALGLVATH